MDKYEVTNALYKICVMSDVCLLPVNSVYFNQKSYSNHPVVYVDQNMARTYCEWRDARLPTESEWDIASPDWRQGDCEFANQSKHFLVPENPNGITKSCVGSTKSVGSYDQGKSVLISMI